MPGYGRGRGLIKLRNGHLQDTARVIYSVAYPHKKDDSENSLDADLTASVKAANFGWRQSDDNNDEWPKSVDSSQSINAWGYDAYGLRLAIIENISQLFTTPT